MKTPRSVFSWLLLIAITAATNSAQAPTKEHSTAEVLARGVEVRYRDFRPLCLPAKYPRMQLDDLGGLTFRELMKREIHDVFHGPWTVEIGTVNIRFPNRVVNVIASIGGMFLADPGDYSLEFLIANPKTGETIATGSIQAIPTIKSLVFGNPFARESSLKKAFRNQTRAMRNYWLAKQTSCGFDQ